MKEKDKKDVAEWLKSLALCVWGVATVVTCAGVWNKCPEAFYKATAVVLFVANGYAIYRKAKLINKNE